MKFLVTVLSLLSISSLSAALAIPEAELHGGGPGRGGRGKCGKVIIRKEWRKLKIPERRSYISAVKCLQNKPGRFTDLYGISRLNRTEDFTHWHKIRTPYVHFVGHFLPFHRYLVATYEKALREECGYKGAQPYWDQSLDSSNSVTSIVFDPDHGFGGNGAYTGVPSPLPNMPDNTGGGCVSDGPFADLVLRIGRRWELIRDDHCLERSISPLTTSYWCTTARENDCLATTDYAGFSSVLEGGAGDWLALGIHGGGHRTVGGTMADPWTSPSEPLFWLHHTNLDRIWRKWQRANPSTRLYDISGSAVPWNTALNPDLTTIPNVVTTLDYVLDMSLLAPAWPIRKVMDTREHLCYDYDF